MILNFIKGAFIGVANIIPGVSGGTFALILGIYDRIIYSMNSFFSSATLGALKKRKNFLEHLRKSGGLFLLQLLAGIAVSLVALSWVIGFLIEFYPGQTLSFFLGLILPSVAVPLAMIKSHSVSKALFTLPAVLLVLGIYMGYFGNLPAGEPGALYVFLSGAVAISAMVLPGLSGSFVLLIMGSYEYIVGALRNSSAGDVSSAAVVFVFALGCLGGLVFFTRVMKFLLRRYRDKTLYFLTGLVLGSVVVLWPFKDYEGEKSVIKAENVLPNKDRAAVYGAFITLGLISSAGFQKLAKAKSK